MSILILHSHLSHELTFENVLPGLKICAVHLAKIYIHINKFGQLRKTKIFMCLYMLFLVNLSQATTSASRLLTGSYQHTSAAVVGCMKLYLRSCFQIRCSLMKI